MSELLFYVPQEASLTDLPSFVSEIPFTGDDTQFWYRKLRDACESLDGVQFIDVHFFDALQMTPWFMRYSKRTQNLSLFVSTPFHAGWTTRDAEHRKFSFDFEAYKVNWNRFMRERKIMWSALSEKIYRGCTYRGTPKGLIKKVAFSVYNDLIDG